MARSRGGGGGAIVNVSSRAAILGSPGEYVDYAASKAAVDAMTTGLALEVADDGIRVNAVRPGLIETTFMPAAASPDECSGWPPRCRCAEVATPRRWPRRILWLLSERASFVTGAFVDVSGGR